MNPSVESVTIGEIQDFMMEVLDRASSNRYALYRGQANASWDLVPPLLRENLLQTEFRNWIDFEADQVERFKRIAAGKLPCQPDTELQWRAWASQSGVLTALSAWSSNPLVALYFATEKSQDEADGVVWRVMPEDESFLLRDDKDHVPSFPQAFAPDSPSAAMENQKVHFLTHPLPTECTAAPSLEELPPEDCSLLYARILIPHRDKSAIRQKLAVMGIDPAFLFPGVEGIGRSLQEGAEFYSNSYDWAFSSSSSAA